MGLNLQAILSAIGLIIRITGFAMIPSLICAMYYQEYGPAKALAITCLGSMSVSLAVYILFRNKKKALGVRDGYLIVSVSWILCSLLGALPYWFSGEVPHFMDALFESASGFTTTGATVLSEWDLPKSILLWRATTNWLGGMAILVFIISVLPRFGSGGHRVAYAEAPWSSYSKGIPRISDLSRMLYLIYITLTVACFLLLAIGEMAGFEALINSLGSVSTAGLLLHPGGVAHYNSLYVESVINLFTILASINFVLYLFLIQRNFRGIRSNVEMRAFLLIIAAATVLITLDLSLSETYHSLGTAFRHAFFQVSSVATTSGYSIGNPTTWPAFSKAVLFLLFFVGGCSASTGGSIKVIRIVIFFKLIARGFTKRLHPQAICAVRVGKNNVSSQMTSSVVSFIVLYALTFFLSALVLSFQNLDFETTLSASAALLSNTGFGLGQIIDGNFGIFSSPFLKGFMCLVMIIGRLELYSIFFLFLPSFWNKDKVNLK